MVTTRTRPGDDAAAIGDAALSVDSGPTGEIAAPPAITVEISGEAVRLAIVPHTEFRPHDIETATEYRAALNVLTEAAALTQSLADRLMDPLDGAAVEGVRRLITERHETPPGFIEKVEGYLYAVMTSGGTLDAGRGSVIVPPIPREEFTAAIAPLASLQEPSFDADRWVSHLYDARPNIGQGCYLFKTSEDWENFIARLIEESPAARSNLIEIQKIFAEATEQGSLSAAARARYDELSRKVLEAQEDLLTPILEGVPGALDPAVRVSLEVRPGLLPRVEVTPYDTAFRAELTRLSGHLLTAENLLPRDAAALRETLREHSAWCLQSSDAPSWGQPNERWIRANEANQVLDVQFDCAETLSLLGDKRNFQLVIGQYLTDSDTPGFSAHLGASPHGLGAPEMHTPLLRALALAGTASYRVVSVGEAGDPVPTAATPPRTPLEQTTELAKRPLFVNVLPLGIVHDSLALGRSSPETIEALERAVVAAEALREANRLDSSTQFIGGSTGEITAHGAALAGAISQAAAQPAQTAASIIDVLAGYEAAQAVRAGSSEPTDRASLGVIAALERCGAIAITSDRENVRVASLSSDGLREAAQKIQFQLQLLQLGIPANAHAKVMAEAKEAAQLSAVVQAGWTFARSLDQVTRRRLREEARREVEEFADQEKIDSLADRIAPFVKMLPAEPLAAVVPNDPDMRALLAAEKSPAEID